MKIERGSGQVAECKMEYIISSIGKKEYLDALMEQREKNIKNGLPMTVNTGIDQAIGILNCLMERREKKL